MKRFRQVIPTITVLIGLGGCAGHAAFVTNTSFGVDFDAKTSRASIAYNRTEGYTGPTYGSGETPSVVGSFESSGEIFNPSLRQAYATGDAATLATDETAVPPTTGAMEGKRKPMFFGTNTTTGFKLGFTPGSALPDELVFGFKRQEASFIPLLEDPNSAGTKKSERYASVLAFYNTQRGADAQQTTFRDKQYFATGAAARQLATLPVIRELFRQAATENALAKWDDMTRRQRAVADTVTSCYQRVSFAQIPTVWKDARRKDLIGDTQFLPNAENWYSTVSSRHTAERDRLNALFRIDDVVGPSEHYLAFIYNANDQQARLDALIAHSRLICTLT